MFISSVKDTGDKLSLTPPTNLSAVSMTPPTNLSAVSLTPALNLCHGFFLIGRVVDTGN
jgi:hypothetical protein